MFSLTVLEVRIQILYANGQDQQGKEHILNMKFDIMNMCESYRAIISISSMFMHLGGGGEILADLDPI